jgi:biopolymer transport protein ExbB
MLLKLGRPHAEVEHAVAEATERAAARLYANVRTLNLAAAISPLLGLLGTVWGMIKAFMATASMPLGANKAEHLAEGIYTALVTTFAGLAVAIPAAVLAHLFEGQIQARLRDVDQLLLSLLPQVERFEGKLRATQTPTTPPARSPAAQPSAPGEAPAPVTRVSS